MKFLIQLDSVVEVPGFDGLAGLAQLVEQQTVMQQVLGSIPTPNSTWLGVDSAPHPSVGR